MDESLYKRGRAMIHTPEKIAFVICPFGEPNSPQRQRSDMLLEFIIRPAVEPLGYEVKRADLASQPGIVTIHVIQHLIEDDLVVADISDWNPNVFYELAIRHAVRRPFVQVISGGQRIPFNVQEIQSIAYDVTNVTRIKYAIDAIQKQVIYYEAGGKVSSPVTVAVDEMIGTRTVEEFKDVVNKLALLERGADDAREVKTKLDEVRSLIANLRSEIKGSHPTARVEEPVKSPEQQESDKRSELEKKVRESIRPSKEYTMTQVMRNYGKGKTDL